MNMLAQILKQQRQAAAYVALAQKVIPLAKSVDDLRAWRNEEQRRRSEYGLTEAQANILIGACREHIRSLSETRGVRP
ncbi:hypothetical protein IVB18_11555 [Bradyrhizobium sp. 186]|uniref:hypothetical protein n=1 Tax=Bradyrhizobium sp. 186 TaxID=2782654 RepID=UPI0020019263|nr:hypothetical protein [Bradyrhizobium sp. 186]UPK37876.1 hypothetical protein IVB18_11555 [Bradyrhizobium sp. 186]